MTYFEFLENKIINDNIEYMPDKKRYAVSYPYTKKVHSLLPNEEIATNTTNILQQDFIAILSFYDLLFTLVSDVLSE